MRVHGSLQKPKSVYARRLGPRSGSVVRDIGRIVDEVVGPGLGGPTRLCSTWGVLRVEGVLGFALAGFALAGSPGPATLSLAATGAAFGARRGLGYLSGLVIGMVLVMGIIAPAWWGFFWHCRA
jgi:hypothetical protein